MTNTRTDAELVAQWRQSVESCKAHDVGDWEATSLHIPVGELDRIVRIAEQGLKYRPGVVDDEWDRIIREAYADNETDADPDTGRLDLGDEPFTDYLGESNG